MSIINLAQLPLTQNIYGFRKKKKKQESKKMKVLTLSLMSLPNFPHHQAIEVLFSDWL